MTRRHFLKNFALLEISTLVGLLLTNLFIAGAPLSWARFVSLGGLFTVIVVVWAALMASIETDTERRAQAALRKEMSQTQTQLSLSAQTLDALDGDEAAIAKITAYHQQRLRDLQRDLHDLKAELDPAP